MIQEIKTYYIPSNPNIEKGRIYSLYINNNNNLNLSSILKSRNSSNISTDTEEKLLAIIDKLYNLAMTRTKNINEFTKEENKILTELSKINLERQELAKKLNRKKGG